MSHALTIARKEFHCTFKTPVGAIFLFFFLLLCGLFFFFVPDYFSLGEASMRRFFDLLPWIYLFFAPAVAMKMWAEEKKIGTIETLMTMPMRDSSIVFGKFLASFGLLALALLLTAPLPLLVAYTAATPVDPGPIVAGYLGALLLGGVYIAISLFASALTESQIVAFILGLVLCFFFFVIGLPDVAGIFPRALAEFLTNLSLGGHFANIQRGVVDSRDLIYYASMLIVFLMLNIWAVRRRD